MVLESRESYAILAGIGDPFKRKLAALNDGLGPALTVSIIGRLGNPLASPEQPRKGLTKCQGVYHFKLTDVLSSLLGWVGFNIIGPKIQCGFTLRLTFTSLDCSANLGDYSETCINTSTTKREEVSDASVRYEIVPRRRSWFNLFFVMWCRSAESRRHGSN